MTRAAVHRLSGERSRYGTVGGLDVVEDRIPGGERNVPLPAVTLRTPRSNCQAKRRETGVGTLLCGGPGFGRSLGRGKLSAEPQQVRGRDRPVVARRILLQELTIDFLSLVRIAAELGVPG